MARQNIEVMLERRVNKLREEEKSKKDDLAEIQITIPGKSFRGKRGSGGGG
jgi:hypothetical protein